ncbi:glycosyltransferase family 2 protein [Seonamhaeicola sp. MEBiC1930]|uniref:glycosyltransferase family 2 protein n=1 Tax=Seonamhaeicola sp. MEBiC01930 TaxID=2976768 RepID=UPI003250CA1B
MIFSILITTYNRLQELKITLKSLEEFYLSGKIEFIICVDGANDGTYNYLKEFYPDIVLINHLKPQGLIASRNEMLNLTKAQYAISLDDDSNFLSNNVLNNILKLFKSHPKCAVQAFSIFWGTNKPINQYAYEKAKQVKGFVGCGHVWNMKAWRSIPNYPDWFIFYGEEEFAAFQLLKQDWEIYYNPEVLVHHRVDVKKRSMQKDYSIRLRRSLRSGWYLFFLFYPIREIPKRFFYTLWIQFKKKVFKGNYKAVVPIIKALYDILANTPRLIANRNRLSQNEFEEFSKLPDVKLYWKPNKTN